jgi:hypothetical protein
VRGGGGNFGVVTSFLFKAHPVHTDYAGPMFWALEDPGTYCAGIAPSSPRRPTRSRASSHFLRFRPGRHFPRRCTTRRYVASCGATAEARLHRISLRRGVQRQLAPFRTSAAGGQSCLQCRGETLGDRTEYATAAVQGAAEAHRKESSAPAPRSSRARLRWRRAFSAIPACGCHGAPIDRGR